MSERYDVAVVGRGIVGLAHALAAARAGARVVVVDRTERAIGASIRNFGFVTVTGQERHEMWPLARRARDVWAEVAREAGIAVEQTELLVHARRRAAVRVLEAFMATEMGEGCRLVPGRSLGHVDPVTPLTECRAALISPHELRVEAREAIPSIARWLAERWGVTFEAPASVLACDAGAVSTSRGDIEADTVFVCPGDDLTALYHDVMAAHRVTRCKLHMLRLAAPGVRLPRPVMSDLGLARYEGYAALPDAGELKQELRAEQPDHLDNGVHLIAVQSADGSLVVGDSHHYGDAPDPFQDEAVDALILDEYRAVLGTPPAVLSRWIGIYASSPLHNWFTEEVSRRVHVTVVTCGAGMSTAFAIGERVVGAALGVSFPRYAQ